MSSSSVQEQNDGVISRTRKLEEDTSRLDQEWDDLTRKEAGIRLELRRYRGHKGKVKNMVLVWLEHVDRIEERYSQICDSYYSL